MSIITRAFEKMTPFAEPEKLLHGSLEDKKPEEQTTASEKVAVKTTSKISKPSKE
jgi:hypothetical protein